MFSREKFCIFRALATGCCGTCTPVNCNSQTGPIQKLHCWNRKTYGNYVHLGHIIMQLIVKIIHLSCSYTNMCTNHLHTYILPSRNNIY